MHSRDKSFASSCINFVDVAGSAVAGCFWIFIERDWHPLYVGTVSVTMMGYFFVLYVSAESPRWLLLHGRAREAVNVLNYIAWFNGVERRVSWDVTFIEAVECDSSVPPIPLDAKLKTSSSCNSPLDFQSTPVYTQDKLEAQ